MEQQNGALGIGIFSTLAPPSLEERLIPLLKNIDWHPIDFGTVQILIQAGKPTLLKIETSSKI